jgi:hypothetical protein
MFVHVPSAGRKTSQGRVFQVGSSVPTLELFGKKAVSGFGGVTCCFGFSRRVVIVGSYSANSKMLHNRSKIATVASVSMETGWRLSVYEYVYCMSHTISSS